MSGEVMNSEHVQRLRDALEILDLENLESMDILWWFVGEVEAVLEQVSYEP